MEMKYKLFQLLKENNLTFKDVKTKNIEYYPTNGQVKMKVKYLGTWGMRKCFEVGWLDYDEDGNLMEFKTKDARFTWLNGIDIKYRKDMDEEELDDCDGVIFPEKKPSKKTGTRNPTEQHQQIIKDLVPLFVGDLIDDGVKKMEYYEDLADDYGMSVDGIRKIVSRYKDQINRLVEIHNRQFKQVW